MGFVWKAMALLVTIVIIGVWSVLGNFVDKTIPATWRISQLTTEGYFFVAVCFLALILNLVVVIIDDRAVSKRDQETSNALSNANKSLVESRKEQERMSNELSNANASLLKIESAINNVGMEYDSLKGTLKNKNVQNIEKGGSGIQNNAPNYGNQAGRNLTVNAPPSRKLTKEEKNKMMKALSVKGLRGAVVIPITTNSEAVAFANKIVAYLNSTQYNGISNNFINYGHTNPKEGVQYVKEGDILKIFVGPKPNDALME